MSKLLCSVPTSSRLWHPLHLLLRYDQYSLYRADIVWASEPEEKATASPGGKESRKAFEPL